MANPFQHEHTRIDRGRLLVDNDLEPRTLEITPEGFLTTTLQTKINDTNEYKSVSVQNPLPINTDGIYPSDLLVGLCDIGSFFPEDIQNLVGADDFQTTMVASGGENPKYVYLRFRRPVLTSLFGFAAVTGDFSNVKITVSQMTGLETVIYDGSAISTKMDVFVQKIKPINFMGLKIEFFTSDPVSLTGIALSKDVSVVARFQALQPDGTVVDIGATSSGNLKVTDAENGLAIAKGAVIGSSFVHKFGVAPDFDTGDDRVTVWDGADDSGIAQMVYVYSTTADIDTISSSVDTDTQDIEIHGLDVNWEFVSQTVTLTGQTKKALLTPLVRVFRMKNIGAVDIAGIVYCYVDTDISLGVPDDSTQARALIRGENNQTLMAVYTVPAGKTAYIRNWFASTAGGKKDTAYALALKARAFGGVFQIKQVSSINDIGTSNIQHVYEEPEKFEEKTDLEMIVRAENIGISEARISAGFDIVLIDNDN